MKQNKGPIAILLLIQMGCAGLMALQPLYYQRVVSLVVQKSPSNFLSEGMTLLGILALIYLCVSFLQSLGGYVSSTFSASLLLQLQIKFFKKINQLPLQFFQHQPTGEFMTRFNSDVGQTQALICHLIPTALRETILILTVLSILFAYCPAELVTVSTLMVFITSCLIVKLNHLLEKHAKTQRHLWSKINQILDETVQGIDTLKIFAGEKKRICLFEKLTSNLRVSSVRAGIITSTLSPGIEFISRIVGLFIFFVAFVLIGKEKLSLDQFLLFIFYSGLVEASVSALIRLLSNLQPQMVSAKKLFDFLRQSPEVILKNKVPLTIHEAVPITITNLHFSYPGGNPIFNNANLVIPANGVTIIHGPSGSGKSTLINLLLGFYAPDSGSIQIGNNNIKDFHPHELRRKIAVVTQFHHIFHDTLLGNITVSNPEFNDEEIGKALSDAQLNDLVERMPNGIHEILDPRGKGISGGEKQRICIARLLLKQAPIVILDEPWSNLDTDSRNILARFINRIKRNTTILILTHDSIPTLHIDRTYCLSPDQGRFKRMGQN